MKEIYKLKEEILDLYRGIGFPLVIASKVVIALISVVLINLNIGTLEQFKGLTVVFGVSIVAGVLPISLGTIVLMCFTLGHVFAVSYIAAAIIGIILTVLFIFGKLFSPRETYLFVGAFIICLMGGTYAVPLVLAMIGTALGVVPVLGGVAWFSMITLVASMKNALLNESVTEAVFAVLEGIMNDRIISLSLVAIGVSYVIAAVVKNTSINESWKMGLFAAAVSNVVIMIIGGVITSTSVPFVSLLLGTMAGLFLGLIIEIFVHNVDYRAVETLRFEDDEYCYYVKAVPKKDPPKPLVIPEPTRGELRQQAKDEAKAQRRNTAQRGGQEKSANRKPTPRGAKETPQQKRAREREAQRHNG